MIDHTNKLINMLNIKIINIFYNEKNKLNNKIINMLNNKYVK